MLIYMRKDATPAEIELLMQQTNAQGHKPYLCQGPGLWMVHIPSLHLPKEEQKDYENMPGVARVVQVQSPYPLASRALKPDDTHIRLGKAIVGGQARIQVFAGPCSVESRTQLLEIAAAVKEAGAVGLRGGAFKPRTSPYSFQGHEEKALQWLAEAREQTGLAIITEVMEPDRVALVSEYADVLQLGSRNMQNFPLLKAAGQQSKPVLLKRGMTNTIEEFLLAAEYILAEGNTQVMLCERGIRTFSQETRNTFDANAIPALKAKTHLPVVADPSHATGKWEYVEAIARSAVAAGADALLVEVHTNPAEAQSDGRQSLTPARFQAMMEQVHKIAVAMDRGD